MVDGMAKIQTKVDTKSLLFSIFNYHQRGTMTMPARLNARIVRS